MFQHLRVALGAVDPGDCGSLGKCLAKLRMVAGAMVAFAVVFPDELPVAFLNDGALEGDFRFGKAMRQQIGLDHGAHRHEIGRLLGEADEDVAADALTGDGLQAELGLVEAFGHLPGEQQSPVQLVGPLMVGADQLGGGALLRGADAAATMPAGIVEGLDLALLVANDHHRIVADLNGYVAARLRQFAIMADEQPVAIPDQLHVELEIVRVGVEGLLERETLLAAVEPLQHVVARIHVLSSSSRTELVVMEEGSSVRACGRASQSAS